MNGDLLDLILIFLVIAFGVSGYRQGFIIGACSFIGFVGGGVLGVYIAPSIATAILDDGTARALLAIIIVFLTATIGQFASSTLGAVVRSHVTWEPARVADAVGGTFSSALSVLVIAWLIGSLAVSMPIALVRHQVNGSLLLATVDQALPQAAKDWQASFKDFVDTSEFPQVFGAIGGARLVDVPPPDRSVPKSSALKRARKGIVKVVGNAPSCRKRIEGTGFVYARNRVMTNAHVVAGVTQDLRVTDHEGRTLPARVVHYNPRRDIAVLYVPDLNLPVLEFEKTAEHGDDAIIAGYPRGKGFTMLPARVRVKQNAQGPDIYNRTTVVREVYAVRGLVQPGNSGGPLLSRDGDVFGVIFAAATEQPETGYVLTSGEVSPDAEEASAAVAPVDTQSCD